MSQKDQEAVQAILGNEFYKYMPGLALLTKSVKAGVLLSYLLYWQGKGHRKGSIYKSIKDMRLQTGLTRSEQETAIQRCVNLGILNVVVKGIPATRHFIVDTNAITNLLATSSDSHKLAVANIENTLAENNQTITENNKKLAKEVLEVYRGYILTFGLKKEDCKLTPARQKLIADRIADAGFDMVKRAIIAASNSEFYLSADDRIRRGTIENIFKSYEKIENLANMPFNPYADRH